MFNFRSSIYELSLSSITAHSNFVPLIPSRLLFRVSSSRLFILFLTIYVTGAVLVQILAPVTVYQSPVFGLVFFSFSLICFIIFLAQLDRRLCYFIVTSFQFVYVVSSVIMFTACAIIAMYHDPNIGLGYGYRR